jgi:diguanylate cyclase (GGDEF)-like protein
MKEAEEVAAALARAAALLRERTAERDRAARAEAFLRREQRQLEHQASHDVLTGLMNRQRFDTVIHERVAACDRDGGELTLLYIDVDGFKRINDLHGHVIGDELLRLFAARMKAGVRESEVVARLGGDEFAVILDHAMPAQTLKTADGLIDRLSRPYRVGPLMVEVSASIGLAAYPASGTCARTLLEAADEAMYRAKRGGKCRHVTSGYAPL